MIIRLTQGEVAIAAQEDVTKGASWRQCKYCGSPFAVMGDNAKQKFCSRYCFEEWRINERQRQAEN